MQCLKCFCLFLFSPETAATIRTQREFAPSTHFSSTTRSANDLVFGFHRYRKIKLVL